MVTSIVLIALIGTLQLHSAISAEIHYEPIKITVNENFNAQPGQVFPGLRARGPGIFHQGANFYFKPQLNLPQSYIPSHIEALIDHSCAKDTSKVVVEKDKLIEILKPFKYPLSYISKETLSKILLEKENNLESLKPIIITEEPKPFTPELLVIPEIPVLPPSSFNSGIPSIFEEEVKKEESIILEEPLDVFSKIPELAVRPIMEPIINYIVPKPTTSGLVVIPDAPVLPPLSLNDIQTVEEEVKIEEPIVVDVQPETAIQELVAIPEAPVIPSLSLHDISSIIEEQVKKEESIIFEESTGLFPTVPEIDVGPITEPIINYVESELVVIPEAPVLPLPSFNGISSIVEEEVKQKESIILEESTDVFPTIPEIAVGPIIEPIISYLEPKPITSELVVISEAPVLPPLSVNGIPSIVEEEVKQEESIIFEEPTGMLPTIPEITVGPITEPIINYVEPKHITSELVVIPEAPILPPLSFNSIPPVVEEEVKKYESIILEESTDVFPTIPEIAVGPIMEPIISYLEPKPITSELVVISEAPVLPPLSFNGIPPIVEEEVKQEESIIFEEPTGVFPTIPEITVGPITEPIINYVEPKPITSELVVIPEAPVLPPLSYNGITRVVEEEKIEESIKVEESTGVFPSFPEISARPFSEPLEVFRSETAESFALENNFFPVATEEVKIEIPILLEESIEVFPPIAEISSGPTLQESSSEITDSYVLEEVSQPNPESVVTFTETLPPTIIPKPSNHLGVFSYVPFVSHLPNRAPNTQNLMIPKPASLERFLPKEYPFRLPITPFPKLDLNAINSMWGNKRQFLYPTSYAHDVFEKHIAPNMAFKKQYAPKRVINYIRPNVRKGPSYF